MRSERPIGIKVVAGVLFTNSAFLFSSAAAAIFLSDEYSMKYQLFLSSIPYFRNNPLAVTKPMLYLTIVFALWALAKGLGIWFMWRWARILIVIDLASRFGSLFLGIAMIDKKQLSSLSSSSDFVIGVIINLAALVLLTDSATAQAFEDRDR